MVGTAKKAGGFVPQSGASGTLWNILERGEGGDWLGAEGASGRTPRGVVLCARVLFPPFLVVQFARKA